MKILVTNDDGVYAPGLRQLAEAMKSLGEVIVVAPDRNRSGASCALTLDRPVRVMYLASDIISVEGTPTDCVHLASTGLLPEKPDMVVSGINAGSNLGDDVFYSGTVAAAMQGRFMGLPSVAISLASDDRTFQNYQTAAMIAAKLVKRASESQLPQDAILNVNVPDVELSAISGYEVTRLGARHMAEPTVRQQDPRGNSVYWIGLPGPEEDAGPGTDFHAIRSSAVSITPIQLDLTNYKYFDSLAQLVTDLNQTSSS